ncbi:uncharacterized protein LOC103704518 [Phoenix dactylifera]|uniref:Uncharacterized protein LOC103704518 n=1 Tax=Phoenix dactylifera TaxID=42345 RepID=A0A8B7BV68_PHODC|nr:uncharacterized protein LOC103704518 [Phoenix dactylifera]
MPFQMKIQPIGPKGAVRTDPAKPAGKSRLKRLFERQFPSVLRISSAEKLAVAAVGDGKDRGRDDGEMVDPSSLCLDRMVLSFIEEGNEKPPRSRCNCFNGNCDDSSDDEFDVRAGDAPAAFGDAAEFIKGLVPCASVAERNLLADASKILEKNKNWKNRDDCRRIVTDGLQSLGYDASICKSRWEKTPSFPAGEYEYVDAIVAGGERLLVDVDFRSEFEIARSTKNYRAVLQSLPSVFVGKPDRLQQIVAVVSEAARQSMKKKGLSFPPWRNPEYMKAKWLSTYQRTTAVITAQPEDESDGGKAESGGDSRAPCSISAVNFSGEFELRFEDESGRSPAANPGVAAEKKITVVVSPWQPPEVKPKTLKPGTKVVTGLASVL